MSNYRRVSEDIKVWSSQCQELEGCGSPSSATFWTFAHPAHVDDLQKRRQGYFSITFRTLVQSRFQVIYNVFYWCDSAILMFPWFSIPIWAVDVFFYFSPSRVLRLVFLFTLPALLPTVSFVWKSFDLHFHSSRWVRRGGKSQVNATVPWICLKNELWLLNRFNPTLKQTIVLLGYTLRLWLDWIIWG